MVPDNYDTNTQSNNIAILEVELYYQEVLLKNRLNFKILSWMFQWFAFFPPIQFSMRAYPIAQPLQNANLGDDFCVQIAGMGKDPVKSNDSSTKLHTLFNY